MAWFKRKTPNNIAIDAQREAILDAEVLDWSLEANKTLTDVLANNDLVEVVTDCPVPFVIVSRRDDSSTSKITARDAEADPSGIVYRSNGQPVPVRNPDNLPQHQVAKQLAEGKGNLVSKGKSSVDIRELGSSSPSPFVSFARREYNNDLIGLNGLRKYDEMRRSDGTVRGTLRGAKTPVLAARWFMSPNDRTKAVDKTASDFVWKNLTELMNIGWSQVLTEALLMLDFGYYMFEIIWDTQMVDGVERLIVTKLSPRHPMDVSEWDYDSNGGPNGVWMWPSDAGANPYDNERIYIPIDKLLVFTFDREAGDLQGISLLRSAYKHWFFLDQLYKIDAIQKERHGIGVPVIELPPNFSDDDKAFANELGRNLRTNERAHIVKPPLWVIGFAKIEGQLVNALESINEHKAAIRENILMGFTNPDHPTNEDDQLMFLKATRFIADIVREVINLYLVPKITDANFVRAGYPKLNARRIGETKDWREFSFALRNLIGSGVIVPDEPLEEVARDLMDLPPIDHDTRRFVATPQNQNDDPNENDIEPPDAPNKPAPPRVGPPRQSVTPPVGVGKSNVGKDRSGA